VARHCRTCGHEQRPRIELLLARGVALRIIARRFDLNIHTLSRHRKNHMPPGLRAALALEAPGAATPYDLERLRKDRAEGLLQRAVAAEGRILAAIGQAETDGDTNALARLWGRWWEGWANEAKLLGELSAHSRHITQNILINPTFIELRAELVQALAAYPEAKRAVARALHRIESKAVEEAGDRAP
jgi:hypothetical protein